MGAAAGLQFAIRHPEKIGKLAAASVSYDASGWQPAFLEFIPMMVPDFFVGTPMEDEYRKHAANPEGFRALVEKLIALEHEPMAWEEDVKTLETPILIIAGDADVMGDMGEPLPESRLAILPATSHTAVINQTEVLRGFILDFLEGNVPAGFM